jgi:hypothetical protein
MDPITAALVAAIAAGATEVGKTAVVDVYNGVKALIKRNLNEAILSAAIRHSSGGWNPGGEPNNLDIGSRFKPGTGFAGMTLNSSSKLNRLF